ncbi:hypothetical protein [Microcoleus sp.]|uniref:hypothetical protein n=1 Tax=Microcoleus sp. TaxID=44472 RepID=UPI0035234C60
MPDSTVRSDDFEATGRSDGCTRTRSAGTATLAPMAQSHVCTVGALARWHGRRGRSGLDFLRQGR